MVLQRFVRLFCGSGRMKKKVNAEGASKVRVPVVNWGLLGEENYVTDYV